MKIGIIVDNTVPLPAQSIVQFLEKICKEIQFVAFDGRFHISDSYITLRKIKSHFEACGIRRDSYDLAIAFTNVGYDNNYFYQSNDNRILVSLDEWNSFTDLPQTNGMIYFIAQILIDILGVGKSHDDANTGCINDFLEDKRGVDTGMRAAFVCRECLQVRTLTSDESAMFADVQGILNALSSASRLGRDVLSYAAQAAPPQPGRKYDVFLCHNSSDKPAVRAINEKLKTAGISTWLDEDEFVHGDIWQKRLEEQIENIASVIVFVGEKGLGPWEEMETRAFLAEFVRRDCLVIPAILPGAPAVPKLPIFLRQMHYADFREKPDECLLRLLRSLRRPGP
jgi:hypothetical protein